MDSHHFDDEFDGETPFDLQLPSPPAESEDSYICPQDVTKSSDLDASHLPSHSSSDHNDPTSPESQDSPDSSAQSKKKRKSWGQVLPEPTTNLPPRKRAKTEAEKEQRKYERVQRNRQAAHNSRMRKQQEMDNLSRRNADLERRCTDQKAEIDRLRNELRSARGQSAQPPLSPCDSLEPTWSVSAPSLCEAASPTDTSSTSLDQAPTPCDFKFEPDSCFDMKKFDDSQSAALCAQQWTSDFRSEQSLPISLSVA